MPGIPTYDPQVASPDTVRGVVPTASGASPIGAGLQTLGQGMASLDADLQRQLQIRQQAEQKQADERAKVWAGQQAGTGLLDETQRMEDAQRTAPPGADGFTKNYLEGFDSRAAVALAAAPDEASKRYLQGHILAQRIHLGTEAQTFQFKAADADVVNRFSDSADTWGKVVEQDPSQYAAAAKTLSQTFPDVRPEVRQKLQDKADQTLTNAAAAHWLDADPYTLQEATSRALGHNGFTGPTGFAWADAASPTQIKTWNEQATTKIRMLEAQMARDVDAKNKIAERTFNSAFDLSNKGQFFDAPFQARLLADTRGTQYEGEANGLISDQQHTAGFASGTSQQRADSLNTMRSSAADPSQGTNPKMSAQVAKFETIDSAITTAVAKDPWEAAQQYGVLRSAPLTPITSAADAVKLVQQRVAAAAPVESWAGGQLSPFRPQEASQFADLVRKLPAPQAASLLGQVGDAMGSSDRVAALAKQIKDKDGVLGLAMSFAGTQTTEGRYASELVLAGDQRIKDKQVKVDGTAESGWMADITKQVRGAYANKEVEDQVVKSAFLIAAAKDGDTDNAVRLATGGGVIEFNGAKVPMPVGYSIGGQSSAEDKFQKAVAAVPPEQIAPQAPDGKVYVRGVSMPASQFLQSLPQSQLVMAGRSRSGGNAYAVRAGNTLVTNAAGRPILINLQ